MEPAYFRDQQQESNQQLVMDSSCYGLSWNDTNLRAHELAELQQLARIKDELSVTGSFLDEDFLLKNNHHQLIRYNDNNQDMLIKTLSNGCQIKSDHLMNLIPSYEESIFSTSSFSQIFPPLKFSNLNQPASYPTFNGSFNCQPSFNAHNLGHLLKANCLSYGVDQIHSKIAPTFIVETKEAKRPARNDMDAKAPNKANQTKKSKLESCRQLKVRKEKLGDRILALQQMVAPFGKTDTASVLMEAIGYIKFLHNQVETLSIPYMNSTPHAGMMSTKGGLTNDGDEETKIDLRSRGLCLVPLSCLTYVTYGGGSVWATL